MISLIILQLAAAQTFAIESVKTKPGLDPAVAAKLIDQALPGLQKCGFIDPLLIHGSPDRAGFEFDLKGGKVDEVFGSGVIQGNCVLKLVARLKWPNVSSRVMVALRATVDPEYVKRRAELEKEDLGFFCDDLASRIDHSPPKTRAQLSQLAQASQIAILKRVAPQLGGDLKRGKSEDLRGLGVLLPAIVLLHCDPEDTLMLAAATDEEAGFNHPTCAKLKSVSEALP